MNREEAIKQVAENYASQMCKNCSAMLYCEEKNKKCVERREQENVYVDGANWADNNPANVWHEASEEPEHNCTIAYATKNNKIGTLKRADKSRWSWYMEKYSILMWAYVDDLLPKGGEKWQPKNLMQSSGD